MPCSSLRCIKDQILSFAIHESGGKNSYSYLVNTQPFVKLLHHKKRVTVNKRFYKNTLINITMKKITIGLSVLSMVLIMCDKQTNEDTNEFTLLNGNGFVFIVDRVSSMSDVQFPSDNLQENQFTAINEYVLYDVTFSEAGDTVNIEPGEIKGIKTDGDKKSKHYELVEGVFAGGRFIVWKDSIGFQVERTIYGSGIPILKSERGKLELATQ